MEKKERDINLDLIRCIAVISVISVHFFLNTDFYTKNMVGKTMCLAAIMRTAFMVCVPLFILLTGYLMNCKILQKGYYKGIYHTLETYIIVSIIVLLFKYYYMKNIDIKNGFFSILGVNANGYAWYVEMYIGLFLLIPFLNIIWNGLHTKKEHVTLIITLMICTTFPTVFTMFHFFEGKSVFPDWWVSLYPIMYYYVGAYIKKYSLTRISPKVLLGLLSCTIISFGIINFFISHGGHFLEGEYNKWYGFQNVINSILLFLAILNIKLDRLPVIIKKVIIKISQISFGIYLISYIFDNMFYPIFNISVSNAKIKLWGFFIMVPLVFFCSVGAAQMIEILIRGIRKSFCMVLEYK